MKLHLIVAAAAILLAACGDKPAEPPAAQPTPSASAVAEVKNAEKPAETVRAPAPPPPAGGGKSAPEIPPEVLKKIQEDLAKNPPKAPEAAKPAAQSAAATKK